MAGDPRRYCAGLPGVARPGPVACLAGTGNRVGLPHLLARFGIERRNVTANTVFAAGHPDYDLALGHQWRHSDVVCLLVVSNCFVPDDLAGFRVQRDEVAIKRAEVHLVVVEADTADGRMDEGNIIG